MSDSPTAVNHHAAHRGFSGVAGMMFGLMFLLVGRQNARRANEIAAVGAGDHVVDIG